MSSAVVDTPMGPLLLTGDGGALTGLHFGAGEEDRPGDLAEAAAQLEAYFAGRLTVFDLPLRLGGTPFQQRVWDQLQHIPYGETWTYRQLAAAIGDPRATRAVGMANNRNPVSIIVPCHRVIGAGGSLTGYGGGLERKSWLLGHERGVRAERLGQA